MAVEKFGLIPQQIELRDAALCGAQPSRQSAPAGGISAARIRAAVPGAEVVVTAPATGPRLPANYSAVATQDYGVRQMLAREAKPPARRFRPDARAAGQP